MNMSDAAVRMYADALAAANGRIAKLEEKLDKAMRKACEMRNAIDMIEGAMMGLGDFTDLPDLFEGTGAHVKLAPQMTVGEMRRVCAALAECTRIINSDEIAPGELRRHAQGEVL